MSAVLFAFFTLLLDVISLGIIIPVLPHLMEHVLNGDIATTALWIGAFAFILAGSQFFMAPLWGQLSDRFGRRPIILISCFFLGISNLINSFSLSITGLLIARVLVGIFSATNVVINAYVADVTTPENRTKMYGLIGSAWGIGFVLGPAIGGILGEVDLYYPFMLASGLTFINFIYGLFVLPESHPKEKRSTTFAFAKSNPISNFKTLLKSASLLSLFTINTLYFIAHYALSSVFVIYCSARYQWNTQDVGIALVWMGVLNFVVQAGLVRSASKYVHDKTLLYIGYLGGAAGFIVMGFAANGTVFYIGVSLISFVGFAVPAIQSLMSKRVSEQQQGALQGANSSLNSFCGLFAPLLFTYVFSNSLQHWQGAAFYLAAAFLILATILSIVAVKKKDCAAKL